MNPTTLSEPVQFEIMSLSIICLLIYTVKVKLTLIICTIYSIGDTLIIYFVSVTVDPRNDCPEPVLILYGSAGADYLNTGTIAVYSCLEGYVLKGQSIVHCNVNTNNWPKEDIPSCSKLM